MKARKVKKEHGKVLAELEEKIALQERALALQTRQAAEYREKSMKLIHELLRGLEAINENNYRFLTDILSERVRSFLTEEKESTKSD